MEVTLRKAAALSQALADAAKGVKTGHLLSLSIYGDADVATKVKTAQEALRASVEKAVSLLEASAAIREQVGQANSKYGVNRLLREKASLEAIERVLSGIGGKRGEMDYYSGADTATIETAEAQLQALKNRAAAMTDRTVQSSLSVNIIDETVSADVQDRLDKIRLRKIAIKDELDTINASQRVEISEGAAALLKEFKLI